MGEFLSSKEMFALVEVMIGARAFSKMDLLGFMEKLKRFMTVQDRKKLQELIRKEMYHYPEVKHDCESIMDNLWQIVGCIVEQKEISIEYYHMDRSHVTHRLQSCSQIAISI